MEEEVKLWLKTGLDFKKINRLIKKGYSAEKAYQERKKE